MCNGSASTCSPCCGSTCCKFTGLRPRDRVRESIKDLHWLQIAHRIKFKLCTLMHGAIFGPSPSYIRDLLVPVSEMQGRTRLHSAAAGLYDVPST